VSLRTLAPPSRTVIRSVAAALVMALAVGLVAAIAKRYLDFSIGVPGHAGVGWIAVLVFGHLSNGRSGMATVAGTSMGFWGVPIGLGHTLGYNVLLYGMAGALLDSSSLSRIPVRRWWGAMSVGAIIHLAKYVFIFANAWTSHTLRRVEVFGFTAALLNHLAFGAAGGLLGWMLWRGTVLLMSSWRPERRA